MERKLQQQIAFYLTGRRGKSALRPMDGRFRPALFARYGDLSTLRYDFPLVLNREGSAGRALLSLSQLVDDAVDAMDQSPERDRIARHGYALERELRGNLGGGGESDFASLWNTASTRLSKERDESVQDSANQLWTAFAAEGDLVDAGSALPSKTFRHVWSAVQRDKADSFRLKAGRLLQRLRDILKAEAVDSAEGRSPERLKAGVGTSFAGAFDFDAMSRILVQAKPAVGLSDERRNRIQELIDVLERQRFYQLEAGGPEPYDFAFTRCSEALNAYRDRHSEAVEFVRTLEIAGLEANGDYRESVHDLLFEDFGANGLDAAELALLPDYLVCADGGALNPSETAQMVKVLAAGLPFKVLVSTDDILERSAVAEGHTAIGVRSRQMVDTAIGLTDVFVLQSCASHLFRKRESLLRGLSYSGPALFSVFSGANGHSGDVPAYLVAAAAMESRVFPALVYDPSAGPDRAARLKIDDNPAPDVDWPVRTFDYEDGSLQARSEELAFTPADFMVLDDRFFRHFAIVPGTEETEAMIPIPEMPEADVTELPDEVPSIALVDEKGRLHRAILDARALTDVRRCLGMWRSLQELGGIRNSHAEKLLAEECETRAAAQESPPQASGAALAAEPAANETAVSGNVPVPEPVAEEFNGDDPYVETARCTTCNECTEVNSEMFVYDDNQQAYIADPGAGTFRQLVEAAEGCQVCIIHPGKPLDPKEPGLDDLIRRAAEFN